MDPPYQPAKTIPLYRATYYCGQKCTWPPEEEWKAMKAKEANLKAKEAEQKRLAKRGKGRPPKVWVLLIVFLNYNILFQEAPTGNKLKESRGRSQTRQAAKHCKCRLDVCYEVYTPV